MTRRKRDSFDLLRGREVWIPQTPAGTNCDWLAARTEAEAWANLLRDAAHMPYEGKPGFIARGYTVHLWTKENK